MKMSRMPVRPHRRSFGLGLIAFLLLSLITILSLSHRASAVTTTANLWVASSGGSANCVRQSSAVSFATASTSNAVCNSLSSAYTKANNNDTVLIRAGTYSSAASFPRRSDAGGFTNNGTCVSTGSGCVTFMPESGASVTLNGGITFGTGYTADGSSNIRIDASDGTITTNGLDFERAHEVYVKGVKVPGDVYWTGGSYVTLDGGEYGPFEDGQGTHPEMQAVYNSNPVISPQHMTVKNGYWHDFNTTNATAHVDCLQIESGYDIKLQNNRWDACGSVDVRLSYATSLDTVLIENNVFGPCANIPVSQCFYSAELGNGNNVVIRNNTFLMAPQPTTGNGSPKNVQIVGNAGELNSCQTLGTNVTYAKNVWKGTKCGTTDKLTSDLMLNADGSPKAGSPVIDAGDPSNYSPLDILGNTRFAGTAPDAGAFEYDATSGGGGGDTKTYHSADLANLLSHYGITSGMTLADGDLDGNGGVNIYDLGRMLTDYSP